MNGCECCDRYCWDLAVCPTCGEVYCGMCFNDHECERPEGDFNAADSWS